MKVILTSTMEYRFKAPKSDGTAGVWAERKCTLSQGEDASLHLYLDGGTQKTQQSFEITPANWKVQEGPTEEELAAEVEATAAAADEAERAATAERERGKEQRLEKREEEKRLAADAAAVKRAAEKAAADAAEAARKKAQEEANRPKETRRNCIGGVLDVHVISGKELAVMDKNILFSGGSSDPYVKVELRRPGVAPVEVGKTDTVKKSTKPKFKRGEFTMHLEEEIIQQAFSKDSATADAVRLIFAVFDKDLISADDEMGEAGAALRDLLQPANSQFSEGGSFIEGFEYLNAELPVENTEGFKDAKGTLDVKVTFEGEYADVEVEKEALQLSAPEVTEPQERTDNQAMVEGGASCEAEEAQVAAKAAKVGASEGGNNLATAAGSADSSTSVEGGDGKKKGPAADEGGRPTSKVGTPPPKGDEPEFVAYPASKVKYLGDVDGRKMFASGQWYTAGIRSLCLSVVDDKGDLVVLSVGADKEIAADWLAALQGTEMPSVARRKAREAEEARLKEIANAKALVAYNNRLILDLCWYGDMDEIKRIMGPQLDLTGRDSYTRATPLHLAAEAGHSAVVKELLRQGIKRGVDVGSRDINGWLPIHLALVNVPKGYQNKRRGNEELPEKGIVRRGHEEIVTMLLEAGSDVNATVIHPTAPQVPEQSRIVRLSGALVNGRFRVTSMLGSGAFGEIYQGFGLALRETVALKFERAGIECPQLRHEYKLYRELSEVEGLPRVHHFGSYDSAYVMVMDKLGPSLQDMLDKCGGKFSLETSLKLADRMLERLELVHEHGTIHRDLKPGNMLMESMVGTKLFFIDFGLARRWRNPLTQQHIPINYGNAMMGTPRFASINNHRGVQLSRRDDVESIAYMLVYFLRGTLPWIGLNADSKQEKYTLIMQEKILNMQRLPSFLTGLPKELVPIFEYVTEIKFEQTPDYEFIRNLLREAYASASHGAIDGWEDDNWDWHPVEYGYHKHHHHGNCHDVHEQSAPQQEEKRGATASGGEETRVQSRVSGERKGDTSDGELVDHFPPGRGGESERDIVRSATRAKVAETTMLSAGPLEADTVLQTSVLSAESKRSEHAPKTNYERSPVKSFVPRPDRIDEQFGVRGWERAGVPLSTFADGETPLHFAAKNGCEVSTTDLLLHNATVHDNDWMHLRSVFNNVESCKRILGVADQLHVKVQLFLIDVTNKVSQQDDCTGQQKVELLFALIDSSMATVHDIVVRTTWFSWLLSDKPIIDALRPKSTYRQLKKRCIIQLQELAEHLDEVHSEEQLHSRIGQIGVKLPRTTYTVIENMGAGVSKRHTYSTGDRQDGPGFLPEISSDIRCTERGFAHVLRLLSLALHGQFQDDVERVLRDALVDDLSTTMPSLDSSSQITSSTRQPTVAATHAGVDAIAAADVRTAALQAAEDSFNGIDRNPSEFFAFKAGPVKNFARMVERLEKEHRTEAPPRTALNLDVMRSAATYSSLDQLRRAYAAIETNFNVAKCVNSYNGRIPRRASQGLSGPEVYGFRDVRVNVKFAPGVTFGMLAMEHCKDGGLWKEYLLAAHPKEQRDITSALVYLRHKSIWRSPVAFICEIQLIYKPFLDYGRSKAFFFAKAVDSENSKELMASYNRPLTFEQELERRECEQSVEAEEIRLRRENIQGEIDGWAAAKEDVQRNLRMQAQIALRNAAPGSGLVFPQVTSSRSPSLRRATPTYVARTSKMPYGAGSLRSPLNSAQDERVTQITRLAGKTKSEPPELPSPPMSTNEFRPTNDSPTYRTTSRLLFRVSKDLGPE